LRNNNSSRFGKFVEVHFDPKFAVAGARITTYLLEKSRLVQQPSGERNYHVFYQMCRGASAAEKSRWFLEDLETYHYLRQSGCVSIDGVCVVVVALQLCAGGSVFAFASSLHARLSLQTLMFCLRTHLCLSVSVLGILVWLHVFRPLCVYVCVCVYVYVYVFMCVCVYVYSLSLSLSLCMYVCVCVCICDGDIS
jgi:Myosin head (motor domain)